MRTTHRIHIADCRTLPQIAPESIDLVVTSPPYPMIEMWDPLFGRLSPVAAEALRSGDCWSAFRAMHAELNKTWRELWRVTRNGALVCINIGDATRTIDGEFRLFPNHSIIEQSMLELGFSPLPVILWRKTTNKPNKFMGSGMLPPGAYVTLEHEYILVFRKGGKRLFTEQEKQRRYESGYFWEERNSWFSDVWTGLVGVEQSLDKLSNPGRQRSAAFPLELAWRLIAMFSVYGDAVLDPFMGTGTTGIAAALLGRSSVGFELEEEVCGSFERSLRETPELSRTLNTERIRRHLSFLDSRESAPKHCNQPHGFNVMTAQERLMTFYNVTRCAQVAPGFFEADYEKYTPPVDSQCALDL